MIQRARDGDPAAREELYRRCEDLLVRYLNRKVGPKLGRAVSVSDLCQATFLQALEALHVLQDEATLEDFQAILYQHATWMIGKQVDKHRRFQGESALAEPPEQTPHGLSSAGEVTRQDEVDWLMGLVKELPEEQSTVVRRRLEGASYREIAEELGLQEDAVRQRYLRGSRELKRQVDARGDADA